MIELPRFVNPVLIVDELVWKGGYMLPPHPLARPAVFGRHCSAWSAVCSILGLSGEVKWSHCAFGFAAFAHIGRDMAHVERGLGEFGPESSAFLLEVGTTAENAARRALRLLEGGGCRVVVHADFRGEDDVLSRDVPAFSSFEELVMKTCIDGGTVP